MHKVQIILLAFICFSMINIHLTAKDAPAAPKTGPANAEYQRIFGEWKTLLGQLGALKAKYRTATKEEKPAMEKQWRELSEKCEVMQLQFFQAAEKAFVESPNSGTPLADLMLGIFDSGMMSDDYENAARIGKLLVDNHCGGPKTASDTGIAAYYIGDLEAADKYLSIADKEGYYQIKQPNDKLGDTGKSYLSNLPQFKKIWDKELKICEAETKADDLPRVLIKTNKGDIEVELFENEAPNTVANFITLVEKGFYNGLTFHRVLPNFMAQGGDPKGDGTGGPGYMIPDECTQPNHRLHFRGSLSMAKGSQPNTGGSQFFLTFVPTSHLDGKHTVFGRIIKGFDVLAKLQRRNPDDKNGELPDPDKIIEAKVLRKRPHEYKVKKVGE
jgi:cyclophilin family peptidyl-prolyl cis-trans isomerase